MIFTAIVYKTPAQTQKKAVQVIAENFDDAKKKLLFLYGHDLVSIIFEVEKNQDSTVAQG